MADIVINEKFRLLIPPLTKAEYSELEKSVKKEGCREPLITWNGYLIDGHNRYEICTRLNIKFKVIHMLFESEEDAISWICSNQLGRRSISEETRKYLIGKRYEAEKIIGERQSNRGINQYSSGKKRGRPASGDYRHRTADKLGKEYHVSHGTIKNYGSFSKVVDRIGERAPELASRILAGKVKISQKGLAELVDMDDSEMDTVTTSIADSGEYVPYHNTRKEIKELTKKAETQTAPSIKDMPAYDPDAEAVGLTLTIPMWASSITRVNGLMDKDIITRKARHDLVEALLLLKARVDTMLSELGDDENDG